ncbi:MAG TPA: hypothetical protein VH144_00450 [Candidatus Saccharimonadales bacterium]|jgi:hypothetical protein|nr:hypothetical protein [Candidatus Saccharimonadales bacterium]
MSQSPEQDRSPEPISQPRKTAWFTSLTEKVVNNGTYHRLEADEDSPEDFLYTYQFTPAELQTAGIDPTETTIKLWYEHQRFYQRTVPTIKVIFEKVIICEPDRTVLTEQWISLHCKSPDNIGEFVSRPMVKDSALDDVPITAVEVIAIDEAWQLSEKLADLAIDPEQAWQIDRLSKLE